ncbi:glycosyltransferase family 2 protein [Terriglobus sp.]|uniref:glycosyltransferase family 2 protein n=1 Tax=Terriglobus sp. TaxID=1889013 RepID=UPI003B00A392
MLLALSLVCCGCAALPAVLTVLNLREYRPPPVSAGGQKRVVVCIPARNEEAGIAACVTSVLRSEDVALSVLVIDDHSSDDTAAIVRALGAKDGRVRLVEAPLLPAGWNGKQHACWIAAQEAVKNAADVSILGRASAPGGSVASQVSGSPLLCFLDADVRLEPAALARMATLLQSTNAALVSGFPLEETGTTLEWLLLPLIHFVLLGYLPLPLLRQTNSPGLAAGCGQFLMVASGAYFSSGGHAAIRETMHDGILLPRLLRQHGHATRLADLTDLARCRMYHSAATTWRGLAKNATEGMAAPGSIVPFTLLLSFGAVLPVPLLLIALATRPAASTGTLLFAWAAVVLCYLPRLLEMRRFRQRPASAALHPAGVATLLVLQWYAFTRKLLRRPAAWKDRAYQPN